jgi:hypothetical protein
MRPRALPRETKLVCEGVDSTLTGEVVVGARAESMIHFHVCSVIKRGVTWMSNSLTFREGSNWVTCRVADNVVDNNVPHLHLNEDQCS